ncbi:hypothetical protein [Cohnella sp. GCM10027633]|uniref:hypothetical protein n=1 Tax=unclassified Cohnella TaxID=2636738 RepID=UPI00363F45CE
MNMRNLCNDCMNEEDTTLRKLEVQLLRNRHMTNEQLSEAADVPEDKLRTLIRAGKLKLYDYPKLSDCCDRCRAPIRKGTLCLACSTKIQDDIDYAFEQERLLKERIRQNTYFARE